MVKSSKSLATQSPPKNNFICYFSQHMQPQINFDSEHGSIKIYFGTTLCAFYPKPAREIAIAHSQPDPAGVALELFLLHDNRLRHARRHKPWTIVYYKEDDELVRSVVKRISGKTRVNLKCITDQK